jgi:uncharacterized membrane protein YbhN (UPF0104 family)
MGSHIKSWGFRALILFCSLSILIDVFVLHRHSHFSDHGWHAMDGWNGFYGMLGFIGTALAVLVASIVYRCFAADEDYYHDDF